LSISVVAEATPNTLSSSESKRDLPDIGHGANDGVRTDLRAEILQVEVGLS
jgi:hypothetical protein